MKYFWVLFLFTCTFSYGQVKVSDELKVKADMIRDDLLNSTSLPSNIQNTGTSNNDMGTMYHHFIYSTTRTEKNIVDSVLMDITVIKDSLMRIQFSEVYTYNDIDWVKYSYAINENGIIYWSYRTDAPKNKGKVIQENGGTTFMGSNPSIIEISTLPDAPANKNTTDKQIAIYKERLRMTLEELYDMLFKK